MAQNFEALGWRVVGFDDGAGVYVINTCTVTENGDKESRRVIRRAKLSNPNAKVAVTGCYAQVAPEEVVEQTGVDYVIGNNFKQDLHTVVSSITPTPGNPVVKVGEIDKSRVMEGATVSGLNRTRGSLKIQDGCDYKCTYCIIWEARGASRSLPAEDIQQQLAGMLEEGFKEVVLTGINIGQYLDLGGRDLADLLKLLCTLDGDFRLRLTSLDPLEVTDKLIDAVVESGGKVAPHFHLSAQSANDAVLKRMARRHHVADMEYVCNTIAEKCPDAAIASDIIVGFPGETNAQFEQTYHVLKNVPMHYLHVFSYSKRKGTPAAGYEDQVDPAVKKERANRLIALSEAKSLAFRQGYIGKTLTVIAETDGDKGMSENYIRVTFEETDMTIEQNDLLRVEITEVTDEETVGRVIQRL